MACHLSFFSKKTEQTMRLIVKEKGSIVFNKILEILNSWISYPFFSLSGHDISIKSIFVLVGLFWGFLWLSKWTERFMHRTMMHKDIDHGIKGSVEKFSRYFVLMVGVFISLSTMGINLNSLTALLVGIGFGLQNITQNFVSGIIILLERPVKRGDIVNVGQISGRVLDIRARSTLILTRDDVVIIVPNSSFISEQVINDSFSGDKLRISVDVGVSYSSNVDQVTDILLKVAHSHKKVLRSPPPSVIFKDFGDSSLDFTLRTWTNDLWFSDLILSELRYEIIRKFQANGVIIPFPQRDLHFKSMDQSMEPLKVVQGKV